MNIKSVYYIYQNYLFIASIYLSWFFIIAAYLGFSFNATYISLFNYYFKVYICLFLIWRFNPFRKSVNFTDLDRKIAYNAGILILTNTILDQYIYKLKSKI